MSAFLSFADKLRTPQSSAAATLDTLLAPFAMSVSRTYSVDTLAAEDVVAVESTTVAARAMFAPDVPVACRTRSGLPQRGRPALAELVLHDGPPVLCVLVGTPEGRWHEEFTFMRGVGGEVARMLCVANGARDQSQFVVMRLSLFWH